MNTPPIEPTYYNRPGWFMRKAATPLPEPPHALGRQRLGFTVLEHGAAGPGKLHHTPVNLLTSMRRTISLPPGARPSGCATCGPPREVSP